MIIIGVDEVGRGCWAGPLVAGAVVLESPIAGLTDSKLLSHKQRAVLAHTIHTQAKAVSIGVVDAATIDSGGITAAVKSAMEQAVAGIGVLYDQIIIDGSYNFLPQHNNVQTLVRADLLIPAVSAASIVAKVWRDTYMAEQAAIYPEYGFEKHVGYGTKRHIAALQMLGPTPLHRMSFKPLHAWRDTI